MAITLTELESVRTALALVFAAALAGFLWECLDVLNAVTGPKRRRTPRL
jgi:hypothetical protein